MSSVFTLETVTSAPVEEGDAGIILKRDGSFRVFSTGDISPEGLDTAQREQALTLVALSVALRYPQVMEVLKQMAKDPTIVGPLELGKN